MSCAYSSAELDKWDGVSNPMGKECDDCYECYCEHWGDCPNDCETEDKKTHQCRKWECWTPDDLPMEAI